MRLLLVDLNSACLLALAQRVENFSDAGIDIFKGEVILLSDSETIPLAVLPGDVIILGPGMGAQSLVRARAIRQGITKVGAIISVFESADAAASAGTRDAVRQLSDALVSADCADAELEQAVIKCVSKPVEVRAFGERKVIAGRYEVVRYLGAGAYLTAYLCKHQELSGELLVVRIVHPVVGQDPKLLAGLRDSILRSYAVSHPHVLRYYEYLRDGESVLFTCEFGAGGNLNDLCSGALPIGEAIRIFREATEGVGAFHAAGCIHGNLKPQNILFTEDRRVKVADGFHFEATFSREPVPINHDNMDYLAPEYLERSVIDERSDIFALGVLAYRMIAGKLPFEGPSVYARLKAQLAGEVESLVGLCPQCPPDVAEIIHRCLKRSPEERYRSCNELLRALESIGGSTGMLQ